ncbi:uncharacterized protein PV09_06433 [Verruconis gallopava]|uniref:LITAF domain-containing protein n=1 Tax=Verruconis gallopava TaxID=253628 RepID=A0A0D2A6B0_9PEZI|nr:uncharacterized protein PV09_06433 [Verruconis gallopava]KIW02283.1 hypothetical protein PV09_06433 [Verruconis gallopava]
MQARTLPMATFSKYDPVPPYDVDDIESTVPSMSNDRLSFDTTIANTERPEHPNEGNQNNNRIRSPFEEQQPLNDRPSDGRSNVYCSHCNRHYGRLTERERCNYALLFVLMSLVSVCICVSIIVSMVKRSN